LQTAINKTPQKKVAAGNPLIFPYVFLPDQGFLEKRKVPVQVFVAEVRDVTVTVATHTTLTGVLVIVKLLVALLVTRDVLKKSGAPEPSSFLADTTMVTPCGGMAELMVTDTGKSACGAAGCTELTGGLIVTFNVASPPPPPPPPPPLDPFLQLLSIPVSNTKAKTQYKKFERIRLS
jgi:hypothetical protein